MQTYLSKQQRSQEKGKDTGPAVVILAVLIVVFASCHLTGCANVTVVKLAELCHTNSGHPSVTFAGESGKVECKS